MSNYPDGMTAADYAYLNGAPDWFEHFLERVAPDLDEDIYSLYQDFRQWARRQEEPDENEWWKQLDKSELNFFHDDDEMEAA